MSDWTAPINVQAHVSGVTIRSICLDVHDNGKLTVSVAWDWMTQEGVKVRSGVTSYTQEQIESKLNAKGQSVEALKALFLAIATEEATA
jgi:hypothetical protein